MQTKQTPSSWIVYILECVDHTLYTGITTNLERRLKEHTQGKGAKYTKRRHPFKVIHKEFYCNRSDASKREYEIKKLDRHSKLSLETE